MAAEEPEESPAQKTPMTNGSNLGAPGVPQLLGGDPNPSYWYQHSYGTCGYQSPWGYGHS